MKEKNKGGRPLKFKTVEELQEKIDDYFNTTGWKTRKVFSKRQNDIVEIDYYEPATVGNLAIYLDTNRTTLLEYEGEIEGREKKNPEYANTIKKAKARIEANIEYGGLTGSIPAIPNIFNLKNNFGWKDKTEIGGDVTGLSLNLVINNKEDKEAIDELLK